MQDRKISVEANKTLDRLFTEKGLKMTEILTSKEKQKILEELWKAIARSCPDFSKDSKNTKLREYFLKAFSSFMNQNASEDIESQFNSLTLWANHYQTYHIKSLQPVEKHFNHRLFSVLVDKYPQVAKRWLTPHDLEAEYGFSKNWQSKARMDSSTSNIPFHKISGHIRYDRYEIDAWIQDHKVR